MYILVVNALIRINVLIGQYVNAIPNESQTCLKQWRAIKSKDKIPHKRNGVNEKNDFNNKANAFGRT